MRERSSRGVIWRRTPNQLVFDEIFDGRAAGATDDHEHDSRAVLNLFQTTPDADGLTHSWGIPPNVRFLRG